MDVYNIISFSGIFVLIGFAWLLSAHKKNMNWRVVFWGIIIQLCFAVFIFMVPAGTKMFFFLNEMVIKLLNSASAGSRFLFGRLALPPGTTAETGETSLGFFLAFQAFPTIIFFSALMSILYFFNIMPRIIRGFSYIFTKLMKVSGAESLCVASNIFVGIESALTVRPYLNEMTKSELCTLLTAGMTTVSSNVMAVYVFSLHDYFPSIAGHLISASLLSAPAALIMSKVLLPETGTPVTLGMTVAPHYEKESNVFEAIINGAGAGVKLIVGIVALLLAILGLVAMLDLILGFVGTQVNAVFGTAIKLSLKNILGMVFYPFTIILGVPAHDAGIISKIIGERSILTEVTAYQDLAMAIKGNLLQSPRSAVICTYALCGFAHVASMAIFIGGVAAIAPSKTKELSQVGFRALVAATLACLMTACIAGTFFTQGSILLGK